MQEQREGSVYELQTHFTIANNLKILEKIMYKRTYDFLDGNGQFYNSQYGFRSKHSCENVICELVGHVGKRHEKKNILPQYS